MNAAFANGNLSFFVNSPNISDDATIVRRKAFADWLEDRSISRGRKFANVFSDIARVGSEASDSDWDGDGAPAVTPEAISAAIQLAAHLPTSWPAPNVSADPDGGIAFEWYKDQGHMVSVTTDGINLWWAGVTDVAHSTSGAVPFCKVLPPLAVQAIVSAI